MVLAAVGQICSTASMSHNLAQCQTLVRQAVAAGAKALFLPEASDYIASSAPESLSLCLPATHSPFVQGLQSSARSHSLPISVGIHEPTTSPPSSSRIANTLLWIDASGAIAHRYQKLHLFDVDLRSTNGSSGIVLKESDSVQPGAALVPPFDTTNGIVGKLGMLICFDLRFPEASLALRRQGAQTLVYPSAFTVPTGKLHWEALLRARAIECQCWVIAAAQCGRHNAKRVSYGESLVVSPRGEVVGRLSKVVDAEVEVEGAREPEFLLCEVDLELEERVRSEMPLQRRTDVYPEV